MTHERYSIEERTAMPFRNPEWHALSGKENRMPNQFGSPEVRPDPQPTVEVYQEEQFEPDELDQLKRRGVEFPLEVNVPATIFPFKTAQPVPETK